jgi:hypothetical protein
LTSYSSPELFAIGLQVVIVLLIVRRSYSMARGVPYNGLRLAVVPALILFLWGLSELQSLLLTPWALPYLIALDLVILILTSLAFARLAERMTQVRRGPSGHWSYQIGFSIAALFLGAFVIRLGVAVVLFPSSLVFGSMTGGFPPTQQQVVLALIDALFSVSAGLLVGRSLGVYRKWRAAVASA